MHKILPIPLYWVRPCLILWRNQIITWRRSREMPIQESSQHYNQAKQMIIEKTSEIRIDIQFNVLCDAKNMRSLPTKIFCVPNLPRSEGTIFF